jgi:hypothetical protein
MRNALPMRVILSVVGMEWTKDRAFGAVLGLRMVYAVYQE